MKTFPPTAITLALLALIGTANAQSTPPADLGRITVTGEGDKLGTGLIVNEEAAKAKSTITKAQLEKLRPTSNPFQALQYLPGVNSNSVDATGLFGGSLRVRGFNSDQMGFTVNGAPVNDSGNFAVFPQEYVDGENLCELYVTQGATDTEAPHVGASGGNVGIATCAPIETQRFRLSESLGQLGFNRTFIRADTGRIGDFKGMLSASKAEVAKWRGNGKADRFHIDAAAEYRLPHDATISASLLYNRAVNNNFNSNTLATWQAQGYYADYANGRTVPVHAANSAGVATSETGQPTYNGYSLNPFRNGLASAKLSVPVTPALNIDVTPYFWYGYGTGGVEQNTLVEGANSTSSGQLTGSAGGPRLGGGLADINGDGDKLDTVLIYRGSVTSTHRPGITTQATWTLPGHTILGGFWYEKTRHRQTQPASIVDSAGHVGDIWLENPAVLVRRADGSLYQGRDTLTLSTAKSVFLQDKIDLVNNTVQIVPAVSWREITRDLTNYANDAALALGSNGSGNYKIKQSFSKVLPSIAGSFKFAPGYQAFASLSKNFRVPSNFELFGAYNPTTGVTAPVTNVKPEKTTNLDVGIRYVGAMATGSFTLFHSALKDRIQSNSPDGITTVDGNVGDSTIRGFEAEVGTKPVNGYSVYASATYTESILKNNIAGVGGGFFPTAGKTFTDTPSVMGSVVGQWAQGPYVVNLAMKFTGNRYITLVNDQSIGAYTLFDLNGAYQLPNMGFIKSPTLRLNVSNIFSKRYYLANIGSGTNLTKAAFAVNGQPGSLPFVFTGQPRFTSVTFSADY